MPLRTITSEDGTECTRIIRSFHPDGTEFLPEEFAIPTDTPEGKRAYEALARLIKAKIEREHSGE